MGIQPAPALALFVAPALLDSAFDMPPREMLRIAPDASLDEDVSRTRSAMLAAALRELAEIPGERAAALRAEYEAARHASDGRAQPDTEYDLSSP